MKRSLRNKVYETCDEVKPFVREERHGFLKVKFTL